MILLPAEAIPTSPPVLALAVPSQHKHLCSLPRKWFSWNIICTSNIIIIFLAGMAPQSNLFCSPTHNCARMVEGEPDQDKQPRGGRERRRKERGKCLPEPELQINEFCAKPNPQRSKIQFLFKPLHNYNFLFCTRERWLTSESLQMKDERRDRYCLLTISHPLNLLENSTKCIGPRWICTSVRKQKQA